MAIPQTNDFEAIVQSLSLVTPLDLTGCGSVVAVPEQVLTAAQSPFQSLAQSDPLSVAREAPVSIWFRTNTSVTFDALLRKVVTELKSRGHYASADVARILLATFACVRSPTAGAVKQLNVLLECATTASVTQFVGFPSVPPDGFRLELPTFELGKLNWPKLANLCERAGTDYHRRYRARFENRFGLERRTFSATAVDWPAYADRHLSTAAARLLQPGALGYKLVDSYYSALASTLGGEFWEALLADQHLLLAAGAPYVDERVFRSVVGLEFVTIFSWESSRVQRHGWVSPTVHAQMHLNLAKVDERVRAVRERLAAEFDVVDFSPATFHPAVQAYSRFLSRAVRHQHDGRRDESFVHFIIALDLLLGSSEFSAKSVSERAAVIAFQPTGVAFDETVRRVKTLYDARSKYVHEGREVPEQRVDDASRICQEVLFALLRFVALKRDFSGPELVKAWHKELDLCVASVNAGRSVSASDWAAAGVSATAPASEQEPGTLPK